ncbi:suppressor of glycerol defect [Agyrium rufum]|nr:suppressor of glycerol defect [Agyrium rufum]
MSGQQSRGMKLPRQLLDQLGLDEGGGKLQGGKGFRSVTGRKASRKASRVEKKTRRTPQFAKSSLSRRREVEAREALPDPSEDESEDGETAVKPRHVEFQRRQAQPVVPHKPKVAVKEKSADAAQTQSRTSRGVRDRLAADDAEIAALEKALGYKGKKQLSKAFEEEGLDELLEGLDGDDSDTGTGKRKRGEDDGWLKAKRQKARSNGLPMHQSSGDFDDSDIGSEERENESEGSGNGDDDLLNGEDQESDGATFDGFEEEVEDVLEAPKPTRVRENPYIAPPVQDSIQPSAKYIPPSLRAKQGSEQEELQRLRRQSQGLLNRLSEANLVALLGDVVRLFEANPRQHVSSSLVDLLMGLLCDPTALQETFIILHAGFIAAMYKVIGSDFGAQMVQRIVEEFDRLYETRDDMGSEKKLSNLASLLANLYSFQVIGSGLVYDYIRIFLEAITETSTELLLRIVRNSGPQLRQDDPSSLKDIVSLLQTSVNRIGADKLSTRTKFMIETVNNLKNNRLKTGVAASTIASEHTLRMKKILGSLNSNGGKSITLKASEPLRISLPDIRNTDKRGKWWLVGASYRDNTTNGSQPDIHAMNLENGPGDTNLKLAASQDPDHLDSLSTDPDHLLTLAARAHRLNTGPRRAIFTAIMSSTDYMDAWTRLMKLRLKRAQEVEIPPILLRCAVTEGSYNPFYTLIAKKVCSGNRKLRVGMQFALWDWIRKMNVGDDSAGESGDEDGGMGGSGTGKVNLKEVVVFAKMYASLVADGALGLSAIKPLLPTTLISDMAKMFLEVFLVTLILQVQQPTRDSGSNTNGKRSADEGEKTAELRLRKIFLQAVDKERPDADIELWVFLGKVVRRSDLVGSKTEKKLLKGGVDAIMEMKQDVVAEEDEDDD